MALPIARFFDTTGDGTGSTDTRVPGVYKLVVKPREFIVVYNLYLTMKYKAQDKGYFPSHWAGNKNGLSNSPKIEVFVDGELLLSSLTVFKPILCMGDLQQAGAELKLEQEDPTKKKKPVFATFVFNTIRLYGVPLWLNEGMEVRFTVVDDIQGTCDSQLFSCIGSIPTKRFDGTKQNISVPT